MSSKDTFNEINITPLTDIFLVLLIIMMVIAPMLDQQGLNLVVPDNVEVTKMPDKNEFLNIVVTADDKYFADNMEIQNEKLADFITKSAKEYTGGLVIQATTGSTHGAVVKLMDVARNSGIKNITLSEI